LRCGSVLLEAVERVAQAEPRLGAGRVEFHGPLEAGQGVLELAARLVADAQVRVDAALPVVDGQGTLQGRFRLRDAAETDQAGPPFREQLRPVGLLRRQSLIDEN